MKILVVSDVVVDWIYSPKIRSLFSDIELVIGCGDLPQYYLEFILSILNIPVFYVNGNHSLAETGSTIVGKDYQGSINLHRVVKAYKGYTFAGVEGSLRYKEGDFHYSQFEMWLNVIQLIPAIIFNRIRRGRFINVFITHAPPWGIHDQADYAHQGIKAFRWFIEKFHPDFHLHGHIHIYRPDMKIETLCGSTKVINAFGYKKIDL